MLKVLSFCLDTQASVMLLVHMHYSATNSVKSQTQGSGANQADNKSVLQSTQYCQVLFRQ
jgi:hypothetical protein